MTGTAAPQASWIAQSNEHAQVVLAHIARFLPEVGSLFGLPGSDERIVDLGPGIDERRVAAARVVLADLEQRLAGETETNVRPGEYVELAATLREDKPALTQRWWFWTAAGALVIGAATTTYFLTRSDPEPTRPPPSGGGLGWSLKVPQ